MPDKCRSRWLVAPLFVFAVVVSSSDPATATQDPAPSTYAAELIETMTGFIGSAEKFSYTIASVHTETLADGVPFELVTETRVAVRRPDRLWADVRSEQVHNRFLYDGERVSIHHLMANVYASADAPSTIDATLSKMEDELDIFIPLADIIATNANQRIMDGAGEVTYLGLDEVDGVSCHHVFVQQDDLDWQIWIEDGRRLVPRKLVFDFKVDEGSPMFTALLSDWDFSPHLPDSVFTQRPPLGARRIGLKEFAGDRNR